MEDNNRKRERGKGEGPGLSGHLISYVVLKTVDKVHDSMPLKTQVTLSILLNLFILKIRRKFIFNF